jgi:SAM-dependent methyltransferase
MRFQDAFSDQADEYARHRPRYPVAMFEFLASIAPRQDLAWDVGTGNGQAAVGLAGYFRKVIATDASQEQIQRAFPHERVEYRVEQADAADIAAGTVDLITVGTAAHWFDLEAFYAEVRRVGKPEAVLAVWSYHLPEITPGIDPVLERYFHQITWSYFPKGIEYVDQRYRTLPFPFEEIEIPSFFIEAEWTLADLTGFLDSWSATREYLRREGHDPVDLIRGELSREWGEAEECRQVRWKLNFRVGRLGS